MKDDIFKKLQKIVTGSLNLNAEKEKASTNNTPVQSLDDDLLGDFLDQILDASWIDEELKKTSLPCYHLSKKQKAYWLLNTQLKTFTYVKSGIEILPIELGETESLCMIGHSIFSVPNKLLVCAGWN